MTGSTRLRDMLSRNEPAFGCWVGLSDPAIIEIVALSGFDYVNIDLEHTSTDLGVVEHMLRAAHSRNISALVRAPGQDLNTIFRIAEMGADGIYIPHVSSAEDARRAVLATRYAPLGDRGIGGSTRAVDYGLSGESSQVFAERTNRQFILWAQIEEKAAVDQIDEIAATDGIDICGIAPFDLARSLGVPPSRDSTSLMDAARHVASRVRAVGKARLAVPTTVFGAELALQLGAAAINSDSAVAALGRALRTNLEATRRVFGQSTAAR